MQACTGVTGTHSPSFGLYAIFCVSEVYVLVPGQISVSDYWTNDKAYNTYSFLSWGAARALELAGTVAVDSEPRESAQVVRDVRPVSSRVRVWEETREGMLLCPPLPQKGQGTSQFKTWWTPVFHIYSKRDTLARKVRDLELTKEIYSLVIYLRRSTCARIQKCICNRAIISNLSIWMGHPFCQK